jgi:hypothetical protein
MTLPRPTFADFRVKRKEAMDALFFDRRFRTIVETLVAYATELERQGATADELVEVGLERIDTVLTPALARVQQAAELGFLVATSNTSLTLQVGESAVFEVSEDTRGLFTPTPFITVTRGTVGTEGQWAVGQLVAWNAETGGLEVEILSITGISGAHTDWILSAASGIPASIAAMASQVDTDAAQVAADRAFIEGIVSDIGDGPVTSVAGKTGAVALVMGDIANLVTTLAAKADLNHSHPQSAITNLVADLAAKAALSHGHVIDDVTGLNTALNDRLLRSGGSLTGALNAADQEVSAAKLKDYALTVNARGNITGAQTIDYSAGNFVTATATGSVQFTVTNPPANGIAGGFVLVLTNGGIGTVTWMSGIKWEGGTPPTLTASGVDVLSFLTSNGGATWRGCVLARDSK